MSSGAGVGKPARMTRMRTLAALALAAASMTGAAACGSTEEDDNEPSTVQEAPLNDDTPSGSQQGQTTPAPEESPRGSEDEGN